MKEYVYYFLLGLSPALFWLWYFYRKDRWEPEPKLQVTRIFLWGIVAIVPAGVLEFGLQQYVFSIRSNEVTLALPLLAVVCFLIVAPIEEVIKYSVVKLFIYHRRDFNEKVDGVIYMVAAAMGFAALENIMYIFSTGWKSGMMEATTVGILRGALSTPAHACFSGLLGVYLGEAKFCRSWLGKTLWLTKGLALAILLHGTYDFIIFQSEHPHGYTHLKWLVVPLLLFSGWLLSQKVQQLVDQSPFRVNPTPSTVESSIQDNQ